MLEVGGNVLRYEWNGHEQQNVAQLHKGTSSSGSIKILPALQAPLDAVLLPN